MPSRAEPIEEKEEEDHTRLPAQMPASRVPRNPVATKDRSGRTQCQSKKTGIEKQVTCWQDSKTEQKKEIVLIWEKTTLRF